MSSPRFFRHAPWALLLGLTACTGLRPHGTLRVHIEHNDVPTHHFRDEVSIDGKSKVVGAGRGGELVLHLSPGTHAVLISSTSLRYGLDPVAREDPSGPCVDAECNSRFTLTRNELELVPTDDARCEKQYAIEVTAGATTNIDYKAAAPGQCDR